ncbi:hypothetical protein CQA62_05665 [Helicobacter cholecystus]|uniref:Uncharacterized protein n=1 Tax=Helicobacter cholecystus TaxID=45498 RepID=A0A3D8ITS6_9HELI|nr:hypothetical protein [Helicobacter cholecystus]RDU68707.1 hypothetical protein CQA62_05665 [Helicobacter cholecystus]VEJ26169.1 Uncharacterised protein [Helicobacter cholecystus]
MSNALSIFEKHLSGADILEGYLAKNIKDINQAIGSLQTIDSALKKAINAIEQQEEIHSISCVFMGDNLMGKEIILLLFGESKNFYIQDLAILSTQKNPQELLIFLQNKRKEISSILDWVMDKMEESPAESSFSPTFASSQLSKIL